MPARDTYSVEVTVRSEYEGQLLYETWEEYLAPDQSLRETMASVMRGAALELAPETGEARSEEAIYAALDAARSAVLKESVGPATRDIIIGRLWDLSRALNVEWYGVGGPLAREESP